MTWGFRDRTGHWHWHSLWTRDSAIEMSRQCHGSNDSPIVVARMLHVWPSMPSIAEDMIETVAEDPANFIDGHACGDWDDPVGELERNADALEALEEQFRALWDAWVREHMTPLMLPVEVEEVAE